MVQFQIQDVVYSSLVFRHISQDPIPSDQPVEINQRIQLRADLHEASLRVALSVEIGQAGLPFEVGVGVTGAFLLSEVPPKSELDQISHVNCAAILFPFAREAIADMTRKGGVGPLLLPPVNFVELFRSSQTNSPPDAQNPSSP